MRKYILLLIFLLMAGSVSAQISAEDAAKLRKELSTLGVRIDSIQKALSDCRSKYETDPQKYGPRIVELEGMIYDANQRYTNLSKDVAQLPEESPTEVQTQITSFNGRNIFKSPFFEANISPKDLSLFNRSSEIYSYLSDSRYEIDSKYEELKSMKEKFDKSDSQDEIDRIIIDAENIKNSIIKKDSDIKERWGSYYNVHIENYLVMIDKLGNISRMKLEGLDALSRKAQASVDPEKTLAPSLADINVQSQLILAYEEVLAERLGYAQALDSIRKEAEALSSLSVTLYPDIEFPYRTTCVYGNPTLGNAYSYSKPSEIPTIKIPTSGVYYSIVLYTSQSPVQQLSTFKGAQPLQFSKSGGYYRYYVGGFRTYAEASKSLVQMQKSFKAPRIVAWLDGASTTIDKAKLSETAGSPSGYFIQVKSSKPSTVALIKEMIEIHAQGKNWTKTESATGGTIYRIITFDNKAEAAVIAQIMKTKDTSIEVEVLENK